MEIEKPGNFTRHKDKFVIWKKGYESHKIRRVWAKLECNISCKAINRKLEDLCAITIKIKYKKSLRQQNISYFDFEYGIMCMLDFGRDLDGFQT